MAWTDPRTWTDNELVTAAIMNQHVRDNFQMTMHTLARKSVDETVNNSAALQNDDHLFFSVAANEVWFVQAWLVIDSGATPDIKFGWTLPAAATMRWGFIGGDQATGTVPGWHWSAGVGTVLATTGTLTQAGSGAGSAIGTAFAGIAAIGGTAGTVQLQWAQNTANVSDTKVLMNSALVGCRLA